MKMTEDEEDPFIEMLSNIKDFSEEDKIVDWRKYYKYVFKCILCHEDYGTDKRDDSMICPNCTKRLHEDE